MWCDSRLNVEHGLGTYRHIGHRPASCRPNCQEPDSRDHNSQYHNTPMQIWVFIVQATGDLFPVDVGNLPNLQLPTLITGVRSSSDLRFVD
jgi:hypothetical protein